jgi:hypothetical protein
LTSVALKSNAFPAGTFRYGTGYKASGVNYTDYDYVTVWLGSQPTFNSTLSGRVPWQKFAKKTVKRLFSTPT